jgi:sigma-B regulation protein RsbU (phosphoserine phosphatase)
MIDPKALHRRIEHALAGLPSGGPPERFATRLVPRVLDDLGHALGLAAAHLYRRTGEGMTLVRRAGESRPDLSAELAHRLGLEAENGIRDLPWVGDHGPGHLAVVPVSEDDRTLLALFTLPPGGLAPVVPRGQLASAVAAFHYAVTQHLRRRELEDLLAQARAIQTSLLPARAPAFEGFELAAASRPASDVGGDFFDWLEIDGDTLGLAVADASGHGLPAALQARDVATGLRMGVARDLKIPRTVEKLNRVIHRSGLVTRFISLFYGELNLNGNLLYINAGHPPPQLLDARGFHELSIGGLILGPDPTATYKQGFAHLDRGALLALHSDGVIERGIGEGGGPGGFGVERVRAWMEDWREGPVEQAVEDLFGRLRAFADGGPFDDDVTVMLVRRAR